MQRHGGPDTPGHATTELRARAITRHAPGDSDHQAAIPELSLHRRDAPTEAVARIYPLSLALTTQGDKQVLAGDLRRPGSAGEGVAVGSKTRSGRD
jgi:hypothetical protein